MALDFRTLRYFATVAEELHPTRTTGRPVHRPDLEGLTRNMAVHGVEVVGLPLPALL